MSERYPGYDVLQRRWTEAWNPKTRQVVMARVAIHPGPRFFTEAEFATLAAICDRILPQPSDRPKVPLAAYVDNKMLQRLGDGYQYLPLPEQGEAWRQGLAGFEAAARARAKASFHRQSSEAQDALLRAAEAGDLKDGPFAEMPCALFFEKRVLPDTTNAYYAHPTAWNEIGFGGPASPRGYVRMEMGERDPWEPVVAGDDPQRARRENARVR